MDFLEELIAEKLKEMDPIISLTAGVSAMQQVMIEDGILSDDQCERMKKLTDEHYELLKEITASGIRAGAKSAGEDGD